MTREELRVWLDRAPSGPLPYDGNGRRTGGWRRWFGPLTGIYLGQRSGRTGPDPVASAQPCTCDVCEGGRMTATSG